MHMKYKYSNGELEINVGDVFYHKADGRRMVVIGFAFDGSDRMRETLDKDQPECRFYDDLKNKYDSQVFRFAELSKSIVVL